MKTYAVKELFHTLQGEGANTGRSAVFCRFAGCNLWSGREEDRGTAACSFCDTDFVGADAGKFDARELAEACSALWPDDGLARGHRPLIVLTGGEPMLQVDHRLISALHAENFEVAVETNGTIPVPPSVDWITVSPKAGTAVVQRSGQELKVVYPRSGLDLDAMLGWSFDRFYLQPMDAPDVSHVEATVAYCLENPCWRLSLQTHKLLGLR